MNFAGRIAGFILSNKPLAKLLLFATLVIGAVSFALTPKQYNPEITLPAFEVQIPYAGATAQEVRDNVLKELEEKIAEIPGVDQLSSVAFDGGMALVRVEFFVGEDPELSELKLRNKINANLDQKMGNIGEPLIRNITPDDVAILVYAFTSDTLTQNEMREQVVGLSHHLQKAEGVSNINVYGGTAPALKITLHPEDMKLWGLSPRDIYNTLLGSTMRIPLGVLEEEGRVIQLEIDPEVTSMEEVSPILLGNGISLGDVSSITEGYLETVSSMTFTTKEEGLPEDAVYLALAKKKGENAATVAKNITEIFAQEIVKQEYENLNYTLVRDDAAKANREIYGLAGNLIQSVVIVAIVLFLFLGARAAFVVAFAIPLTLCLVFFAGLLFDQTINRITLFALILSLGLLVDSATVVTENIVRHLRMKKAEKSEQHIPKAVSEIGIGLLLSTLTSVIVFVPMRFITGMMGPYMGPVAFFVPMALFFSLVVAYTLTPFLSHLVLKKEEKRAPLLDPLFQYLSRKYAKALRWALSSRKRQNRILFTVFGLLMLVFTFPLLQIVHFQMLPKSSQNQLFLTLDLPEDSDVPLTRKTAEKAGEILLQHPEVVSLQTSVATEPVIDFNGLYRGFADRTGRYQATIKVNLRPMDIERSLSTEDVAIDLRRALAQSFPPGGSVSPRIIEEPPGPPVMATLVAKVKGEEKEVRERLAEHLYRQVQGVDGVADLDTSMADPVMKYRFSIDEEKAEDSAIALPDIEAALRLLGGAEAIAEFHPLTAKEMAFIELSYPREIRETSSLQEIYIKNIQGEMLPLSDFVELKQGFKTDPISFDEREATTYITGEVEDRSIVYVVIDTIALLLGDDPEGLTRSSWSLFDITYEDAAGEEYRIEWGGEWKMTLENFRDLGLAMIIAFLLIYAILVAQFESFRVPLLIMVTIFLAFLGILPGFAILEQTTGDILTATALIGFIALMGIVVNNAIIFLEYLDQLRKQGMPIREALVEAGRTRLRPIVLTSLTTVLGSLTIAGDPVWSGLAWTIVFGLSLSAFLTLGIFPILYLRDTEKRHETMLR